MSTIPKEKLDKLVERWAAIQCELNEGVNQDKYAMLTKEFSALNPIVSTIDALRAVQKESADLDALIASRLLNMSSRSSCCRRTPQTSGV
jgi:peptide chain release factor 1